MGLYVQCTVLVDALRVGQGCMYSVPGICSRSPLMQDANQTKNLNIKKPETCMYA